MSCSWLYPTSYWCRPSPQAYQDDALPSALHLNPKIVKKAMCSIHVYALLTPAASTLRSLVSLVLSKLNVHALSFQGSHAISLLFNASCFAFL